MNSQRLCQYAQGLHSFKPDEIPELRGDMDTAPIPNQKLSPTHNVLQRKSSFSTMESHWLLQPHLKAGPMPSSRWTTQQNELDGIFGDFCWFVSKCFVWAFLFFFPLLSFFFFFHNGFCFFIMISNFMFYCVSCVVFPCAFSL